MLKYCNNCKERSMKVKIYNNKRCVYCLNKGCGNVIDLSFLEQIKKED